LKKKKGGFAHFLSPYSFKERVPEQFARSSRWSNNIEAGFDYLPFKIHL
jgi:hypothetical protein